MKKPTLRLIIAFLLVVSAILYAGQDARSQGLSNSEYQITIDPASHQKYGLYYPVTYSFQIPSGSSNLTAQYRYSSAGSWVNLTQKTSSDFFNGVNAARFDYANNTGYLSIAFSPNSDTIFLRTIETGGSEIPMSYLGMPHYYDNRHAAVTVTLDDWEAGYDDNFNTTSQALTNQRIHFTVGIITLANGTTPPNWSMIQSWYNAGYLEPAAHTRTHPCSDADYQKHGYAWEIAGSRDDILANLNLANHFVPAFLEPCGVDSTQVRQAAASANYLGVRGWRIPPAQNTFSSWGQDGAYQTVMYSYDDYSWPSGSGGSASLRDQANSSFDAAYTAGGIYHLVDHPWTNQWTTNSYLRQHVSYISNRNDVWYAGFGELYLYHYVQERQKVTVSAVGSSDPTYTPIPTATNTPTPTQVPGNTLWSSSTTPKIPEVQDANPIEIGVKFRANVNGYITGIRFFRSHNNAGPFLGHLWTNSGTLLAEGTVISGATPYGWQTMLFATPVPIAANTVYVASYHTDTGYYSMDQPYFNSGYSNGPLYAFGTNEVTGGDGVYIYGSKAFPNQTYQASNYWVDVIFSQNISTPTPTASHTPIATFTRTSTATATSAPFFLRAPHPLNPLQRPIPPPLVLHPPKPP